MPALSPGAHSVEVGADPHHVLSGAVQQLPHVAGLEGRGLPAPPELEAVPPAEVRVHHCLALVAGLPDAQNPTLWT